MPRRGSPQVRNARYANLRGHLQRGTQLSQSPVWILDLLQKTYGKFDMDVCPPNPKFDGLSVPWKRLNYCNPEFAHIPKWLEKGVEEMNKGHSTVFLIPFRPDRKYFRTYIQPNASEIRILSEPVQFRGHNAGFPPRMSVVLLGKPKKWENKDIASTVPMFTFDNPKVKTFEQFIKYWTSKRDSRRVSDPKKAPKSGSESIWGIPQSNMRYWLQVLQEHPNTDLYGLTNDQTTTFIKLLEEPNISAWIVPRHLAKGANSDPSPFSQFAIIGQPPLRTSETEDLTSLPPTYVWDVSNYDKVIGQIQKKSVL